MSGLFITLEGGEGVGKSTQSRLLAARLRALGLDVVELREPGGTPVGDAVREVLLSRSNEGLDPVAELLLYEASRAELVAKVVRPALDRGAVVVCDRFTDSTTAYQGWGRGLDAAMVKDLNRVATGGLAPDVTLLLDMDVREAHARATRGATDRLEAESAAFHARVHDGFLAIAAAEPGRVLTVDASGDAEAVAQAAWAALAAHPSAARMLGDATP